MSSLYVDGMGGLVERRSNHSAQKTRILRALLELERAGVDPDALDDRLERPFYDITSIAMHIFGTSAFMGGKLKRSRRSSLNRSLNALYLDGFITKTGARYRGRGRGLSRDFHENFWGITRLGKKVLSIYINGMSKRWMREHRFYGVRDIKVDRSQVKCIAASDYSEDWD